MKKMYKAMLLVLCAVLLVAGSVMGTLAYLQAEDKVTNTFTVGKVEIMLQEYALKENGKQVEPKEPVDKLENIKLVPNRKIEKNPFITLKANSEACYLFVKIENNIPAEYGEINWTAGEWTLIDTANKVYAYAGNLASEGVIPSSNADQKVDVFKTFTCMSDIKKYSSNTDLTIDITAYAVQAEGFEEGGAKKAWADTFGKTN